MGTTNEPDAAPSASRCSIAPHVPDLPNEALEFAEAVGKLCEQYGIRDLSMDVKIDEGYGTKYWNDAEFRSSVVSEMKIFVSKKDGRGRPRTKIHVQANLHVSVPIVWEKDSSS